MTILNRIRQQRVENDNMSQAQLAREIDVSRQTLNAIECGQRLPSLEVAHRIADALECDLDDVFHYESEFPATGDDDGVRRMSFIVCLDHDPEWWKSDEVSRVTTRAKRCSDAAGNPHNHAVWAGRSGSARRVIRSTGRIRRNDSSGRSAVPSCPNMRRPDNRISGYFVPSCAFPPGNGGPGETRIEKSPDLLGSVRHR